MMLLVWYLALVVTGDVLAYFVGLLVEHQWGSNVSMIGFLAMYFAVLWLAWIASVWITKPKTATA